MLKLITVFFFLGISFAWGGACVASCGPVLISYITGTGKGVINGLKAYILFSLAKLSVYMMLGVLIFFLGKFACEELLGRYANVLLIGAGAFLILMGSLIAFKKETKFKICQFLQYKFLVKDTKSIITLGVITALLPCMPLIAFFSYLSLMAHSWQESFIYTFSFGIGNIFSPLLFLAAFSGIIPQFIIKNNVAGARIFSFICGLIIMVLGIQLIGRAL